MTLLTKAQRSSLGDPGVGFSDPFLGIFAITPSDAVDFPNSDIAYGLQVYVRGTVKATCYDGSVFAPPSEYEANAIIPGVFKRVWSTGTSATVVGLR